MPQILVVEDDDAIRGLVSDVLRDDGYDVREATNGVEALERLREERPDLIVLDLMMPVMDGWAFAQAYRKQPGPHAPIVVLTAAQDAASRAAQIQADDYLGKPFELDDLLNIVARHTRR